MQAEQESLESKNFELARAYKEKTKAHQHSQNLYQALKGQVMASQVAHAAGDEAAHTLRTARGDRFIDCLPGTRTGTANYSQMNMSHQTGGGRMHNRDFSRSSGCSGRQQQGGIHLGPPFNPQSQRRSLGGRNNTGCESLLSKAMRASHANKVQILLQLAHRRKFIEVNFWSLVVPVNPHIWTKMLLSRTTTHQLAGTLLLVVLVRAAWATFRLEGSHQGGLAVPPTLGR
jgi:hypothetical protein